MSSSASNTTTDHDTIREWVEQRGGRPAAVRGTERRGDDVGMLRIAFPDAPHAHDDKLEEIGWDEFFAKFDESDLVFLYQERTADGETSNFNKLISRETADADDDRRR
ncbi:MAG TPA: hypothetical protein VG651_01955 [Stellaceae bacterium]|nr:hypothetical protein [Stellaceae bacterium]